MEIKPKKEKILMGNEAAALGIVDNGCSVISAYPGTPSSEILSAASKYASDNKLNIHLEWSVNEKVAFEVALSNSYAGCRSAVAMKQVGLNVASDPLMSAAYTGVKGGFLLVSADDPGPHSSQTEQDSRFMAMFARIPVLDPSSPREAYLMVRDGLEISEAYGVPVMLRPTTRVCHARQNVPLGEIQDLGRRASFDKDPGRWAATPKFRYQLHRELNQKLETLSSDQQYVPRLYEGSDDGSDFCILSSGVAFSYTLDILKEKGALGNVALYKAPMPHPLSSAFTAMLTDKYQKILVVEETYPVMEIQFADRRKVSGKLSGYVPKAGELTPDVIAPLVHDFLGIPFEEVQAPEPGGLRPSLCPGCPHRASYFAIRTALPKAIYPGDIGCYTLGINLGGVDTCLCMGASVSQAAGFYHSYHTNGGEIPSIVATIGDSTFVHSGITGLVNAVYNRARFILVILDNSTTAMTGNQPTALTGRLPDNSNGNAISLVKLVEGCGIRFLKTIDPYAVQDFIALLKEADAFTRDPDGGIAVIIAKRPCLMNEKVKKKYRVTVTEECTDCGLCLKTFECPAFVQAEGKVDINPSLCSGCGVCVHVCPSEAIKTATA
jgi:indolepyruvate ferredoxin oxidoreductase alpha subunit